MLKSKLPLLPLFLLIVSAGPACPAEFPLLSLIPDDAGSVVGFDVGRVLGSPFGRRILSRMQSDDPRLKILFKLGFDPARDLKNVVVSTGGAERKSLIAASGLFDSKKIAQGLAAEFVTSQMKKSVYEGIEMMMSGDGNALAIPDNNTILLGHELLIRSALDRRGKLRTTRRPAMTAQLLAKAEKWMGGYDLWFASGGPATGDFTGRVGERMTGGVLNAELLKGFDRTYGGLRFSDSLEVGVETAAKTEKDAGTMVKAMKLLSVVSLMTKGTSNKNPLAFLDSLDIRNEGNIVNLKIVVPKAAFDAMSPPVPGETDPQ